MSGNRDWQELVPVKPFGSLDKGGRTHRQTILDLDTRNRLRPGGTALYATVLDAVRELRRTYDPSSVNAVVVFTDGANDDPAGPSLAQALATLKAEADPKRPVLVYAMGIGPGADLSALNQITGANGGKTYSVNSARDVQAALLDALSRRTGLSRRKAGPSPAPPAPRRPVISSGRSPAASPRPRPAAPARSPAAAPCPRSAR